MCIFVLTFFVEGFPGQCSVENWAHVISQNGKMLRRLKFFTTSVTLVKSINTFLMLFMNKDKRKDRKDG